MSKYKKRFIFLIILCMFLGLIGLASMIFCGMHIDWYQNIINSDFIDFFGFVVSITPTVLCGILFICVVLKIGYVACTYEEADSQIIQYKKNALRGNCVKAICLKEVEKKLEDIGYKKTTNSIDVNVFEFIIRRIFQKNIISFVIVVDDSFRNIECLYETISCFCNKSAINREYKHLKICVSILYFGTFDKMFIQKHALEYRDDKVIMNSVVYNNSTQKVHMINPDKLYSESFRNITTSILSLFV